jgi:alpha-1,2-mannosyltransferase
VYGTWNPAGSYSQAVITEHAQEYRFSLVNQLGLWISPGRGILIWTPVILVLLPALVRSWRDLPDWSRALVWSGLVYTTLGGALDTFTGGDLFYGYRYGLEFLACATPALAMAAPRLGNLGRRLIGPVLAVQLFAIATGATLDGLWPSQAEAWHRNAFITLVTATEPVGWTAVGITALLGLLGGNAWMRRLAPHAADGESQGRGAPIASRIDSPNSPRADAPIT